MEIYTVVILLLSFHVIGTHAAVKLPEMDLNAEELIRYWGYTVETHHVKTSDGYTLALHRIPRGKKSSTNMPTRDNPKPVFFLNHPLSCSSTSFYLNLPHQNLAFVLADAGYDVWMGNARGNAYSRKHDTLDPESKAFWDFTFQDMATYDLPAMIDYTLNSTNQKQVYYVGHSQGTTIAFTGLMGNEDLQHKIKVLYAMGPMTRLQNVNLFIRTLASYRKSIRFFCNLFGIYEVLSTSDKMKSLGKKICPYLPHLCDVFLFMINGIDQKNLNSTRTSIYLNGMPSGTSEKDFDHFFQLIATKEFRMYDHGEDENMNRYGSKDPPSYDDLGSIQTPVVMLYGANDSIVDVGDVEWAVQQLPNVLDSIMIPEYNHLDFIIATNAHKKVYNRIIDIAKSVEGNLP